jgi:chemotaxis protein methyltransferase CheR
MQERLYMRFYSALRDGGYFVMGNTETLVGEASALFTSAFVRERIYQKGTDGG